MTAIARITGIAPRWLWFTLAGLIQVGLVGLMVVDRVGILRDGAEVMLRTRPVDPRDFLRGDYVVLTYDISNVAAGELKNQPAPGRTAELYVKLAPDAEGYHNAVSVHLEMPPLAAGEVLIRGRTSYGSRCGSLRRAFCDKIDLKYGIEKYFVPEGEGTAIEHARNEGKVAIVAAVTPSGRAAIKRLLLDGKPVYDEPLF